MKESLYNILLTPKGEQYNNTLKTKNHEIVLNSTIDIKDAKFTNRIGVVLHKSRLETKLNIGDEVIVHTNTFRLRRDVKGNIKDSSNYIEKDVFSCDPDNMFAYRSPGGKWKSLDLWCFVEPIEKSSTGYYHNPDRYEKCVGILRIGNPELEKRGIQEGDKVGFVMGSEFEFDIEGKIYYKMSWGRVICKF